MIDNMDAVLIALIGLKGEIRKDYELLISHSGNEEYINMKERQIDDLIGITEYLKSLPKCDGGYEAFKEDLKDIDNLLGWHSNIACWIMDNLGVVDYENRNQLAQNFIKRFFDIDYDWIKLLNPNRLRVGDIGPELIMSKKDFEKLSKLKTIVFEDYPPLDTCKNPDVIHKCIHCNECGRHDFDLKEVKKDE